MTNFKNKTIATALGLALTGFTFTAMAADPASPQVTTISGGTFKFQGEVVDAACAVVTSDNNGSIILNQARSKNLTASGNYGNQKKAFSIELVDCDNSVSQNVAISYMAQSDATVPTALANIADGNAATNVALQIFGPDSKPLSIGTQTKTTTIDGKNVHIPLSVDYVATGAATAGNVRGEAIFTVHFS